MKTYVQNNQFVNYDLSTTPDAVRIDRVEFDRRLAEKRVLQADSGVVIRQPVRPEPLSGKARREAMASLRELHLDSGSAYEGITDEQAQVLLDSIPDLHAPLRSRDYPQRTPERQAQIEQTRMWANCGILKPHIRKRFPTAISAALSRIVDITRTSSRKCCDWSKAKIALSVGVCSRTAQRAFAAIERGEVPGLTIDRPVNRGPDTDMNIVRFSGTLSGKRLQKWSLRNRCAGRLFDLPKEIIGISETEPRLVLSDNMSQNRTTGAYHRQEQKSTPPP